MALRQLGKDRSFWLLIECDGKTFCELSASQVLRVDCLELSGSGCAGVYGLGILHTGTCVGSKSKLFFSRAFSEEGQTMSTEGEPHRCVLCDQEFGADDKDRLTSCTCLHRHYYKCL